MLQQTRRGSTENNGRANLKVLCPPASGNDDMARISDFWNLTWKLEKINTLIFISYKNLDVVVFFVRNVHVKLTNIIRYYA